MRVQSPIVTTSATAPMVQKPVRCTTAPKAIATKKEAQRTCWVSEASSTVVMRGF